MEPVLNITTDNQVSLHWTHAVSAKAESGQYLVRLFVLLLHRIPRTKLTADWIATDLNTKADIISRPADHIKPSNPLEHHQQVFKTAPEMKSYRTSLPSPEILSLILSLLRWKSSAIPTCLPKNLGSFTPIGFTGSSSVLK